jgi:hypothetical protein
MKLKELEPWIHWLEVDDEARPSTQIHVNNRIKTPLNSRMKN